MTDAPHWSTDWIEGIGLHTGAPTAVRVTGAAAGRGLRWQRVDLPEGQPHLAAPDAASGADRCIRLGDRRTGLYTVEHLLAALAARTHEIGILLSLGFRPVAVFVSFLFEATVLGLLGGLLGCLFVLPISGIQTGTMNVQTFTEVAFAFRVTPVVLAVSVGFSMLLGFIGGAWPAFRAARLRPTEALRRG